MYRWMHLLFCKHSCANFPVRRVRLSGDGRGPCGNHAGGGKGSAGEPGVRAETQTLVTMTHDIKNKMLRHQNYKVPVINIKKTTPPALSILALLQRTHLASTPHSTPAAFTFKPTPLYNPRYLPPAARPRSLHQRTHTKIPQQRSRKKSHQQKQNHTPYLFSSYPASSSLNSNSRN